MAVLIKGQHQLWILAGLLTIAVSAVAIYKAQPILFPEVTRSGELDPDCDLRAGPCVSQLNDAVRVSFAIEPREIPLVKPLHLQVSLEGIQADQVQVDFTGVDMNMGFNRVTLNDAGAGEFKGDGMLPVCVWDAMEWEAKVLISTGQGLISMPYRFITVRPGIPLPGSED
ncbi:MAG: hypothetical protein JAY99_03825 [Candidatus Thiodiazotropha lotti]|uniref:Uncharacterized protein n=1 Tax=Candidatus Thiodiazotropha endoloripes TaxID=1818881 RepID=A0A1E2ULG5_9GAMM|nr:hypothetical protein [Candidatus Thiodiazotropha endoloripes]MCG7899441.1 hypothetical protein [Candidatus Thiodiazotropha weberae]MCG7992126.1 hypothetical protein [Candidatus Thiodiazotropha lotti]MCG7903955.1 hypothetical protein [Candidatus Thiodiazotropha weberae]MCG7915536.1 hypothetical protein [Candidatus Thiodiazotropha weberae]MCG7998631.1 hypothetical protein [Candidatus Thiodiazotropha lotti]